MKKFLRLALFILLILNVFLLAVYYQKNYFPKASYGPVERNVCGYWSAMGGGDEPTCECDGEIVKRGGPSGPADDGGGTFECNGVVTRSWNP